MAMADLLSGLEPPAEPVHEPAGADAPLAAHLVHDLGGGAELLGTQFRLINGTSPTAYRRRSKGDAL